MGAFIARVRKVNDLDISVNNFGDSYHTASSEPYYYDESYVCAPRNSPIPVDDMGRCIVAQEIGERNQKSGHPLKWKCTRECKNPTTSEQASIVELKAMYRQQMHKLRQSLDSVDSGCDNGHYTQQLTGRELAGHPLTCTVLGCVSKLRILRAVSPHY